MASKQRPGRDSKYIVHDGRKFIYFVLQKVACTSVKTALLPLFDLDPIPFVVTRRDGTRVVRVHKLFDASDRQIGRERLLAGLSHEYHNYFKFAFVRNPWDRLLSCYFNKLASKKGTPFEAPDDADVELYANMPFAEFVEAVSQIPDSKANPHFRSQHLTICGPDGEPMADFVGRFESLQEDFARVGKVLGVPEVKLPERNNRARFKAGGRGTRHYRDFYDERLKNLVHERYEKDVETFGYSF